MWRVQDNILCVLDPKVKVKGIKRVFAVVYHRLLLYSIIDINNSAYM